jgi:hypothetical protein
MLGNVVIFHTCDNHEFLSAETSRGNYDSPKILTKLRYLNMFSELVIILLTKQLPRAYS